MYVGLGQLEPPAPPPAPERAFSAFRWLAIGLGATIVLSALVANR